MLYPVNFITGSFVHNIGIVGGAIIGSLPSLRLAINTDREIVEKDKAIIAEGRRLESSCEKIMRVVGRGFHSFGVIVGMRVGAQVGDVYGEEIAKTITLLNCSESQDLTQLYQNWVQGLIISLASTTIGSLLFNQGNQTVYKYLSLQRYKLELQAKIAHKE